MVSVSSRLLRRIAAGSSAYARMARWDDDGRREGAPSPAYATSSRNLSLTLTAYQGSVLRKSLDGDVTLFNLAIDYLEDGYVVLRQARGPRWDGIPELGRVNFLVALWTLVLEARRSAESVRGGGRSDASAFKIALLSLGTCFVRRRFLGLWRMRDCLADRAGR